MPCTRTMSYYYYFVILSFLKEISLANVENLISKTSLDSSNITASLKNLQKTMEDMNTSIQQQNDLITKSEAEIGRNNALIERKQTQIDQLNRKIKAKMSKLGGVSRANCAPTNERPIIHMLCKCQ